MNIHNPASLPSFFAPPPQIKTNTRFMLKNSSNPQRLMFAYVILDQTHLVHKKDSI